LETKKAEFDPSKFEDRYETALKELIAAKEAGRKPPPAFTPQPGNVVSLMDALRRSVQTERRDSSSERNRGQAAKRAAPKSTALKRDPAKRKKIKRAS
jgi:DNA end-binding protein Ku